MSAALLGFFGQPTGSAFALLIDGERYSGWEAIRVTRGLKQASASFELSVSSREPWPVFPGSACEIYINDDRLLTGWIDAFRPSCSSSDHRIALSGRSKTCDFVDCSVTIDGGQLKGLTLREIAEILAEPYGLEIVAEEEGEPVPEVQVQQGETCFKLIERLARLQELLVTDDAEGRLVLTRAGSQRSETALVFAENVKEASAKVDDSKRFSEYIIKAQRPGNRTNDSKIAEGKDWPGLVLPPLPVPPIPPENPPSFRSPGYYADDWRAAWRQRMRLVQQNTRRRARDVEDGGGDDDGDEDGDFGDGTDTTTNRGVNAINQIVGTARDPGITRYRPKVIVAEAQADDDFAAKRADWEMRRRIGEALEATVTVNGWRQNNGELWATNLMVPVNVPWLGIERDMLIGTVEFRIDDSGEITRLGLTLPDAFLPKKVRKPKEAKASGGGKGKKAKTDIWRGLVLPP